MNYLVADCVNKCRMNLDK